MAGLTNVSATEPFRKPSFGRTFLIIASFAAAHFQIQHQKMPLQHFRGDEP